MMITDEWLNIIECSEELSEMVLRSDVVTEYRRASQAVYSDENLVKAIQSFADLKDRYEEVQRFGKYHPDYNIVMKRIRAEKRELDLNEQVAALRLAENDVQQLLDEVSVLIAQSVSEAVKVPAGNGFFTSSCGGGCGSGGSCSCSA
ncbi:YlbF family regulator [Sporosarcina sp. Te-1]|uniref:YlbF family regulator n=1 Tax=Sporosarcina sp. Te-1 TaxID=2818390 RepID=UPI001A9CD19D|nr:YlbF family regulator [Sporosarcina sp. Te-1]QTD42426.1 YlbF family regulator [Sporosarcina sp. Te-1]